MKKLKNKNGFMKFKNRIFGFGLMVVAATTPIIVPAISMTPVVAATQTVNKNVWVKQGNKMKYFGSDGKAYTGWHYMTAKEKEKTPHWSYFGKDGALYTGWHKMGKAEGEKTEHWNYFGDNGWLRTGWQQMGKGTNNPDGNNAKHWSYFGDNGWLRTGWQQMGKGTNNPDGNNAKHWSYFGDNGWLKTGWQQMGKGTNNPDGNNTKHWSYFGTNGWLTSSNKKLNNTTYIFNSNGWLTGAKYDLKKNINQRNTGFGSMGCGGASATIAMQANGFNTNLQPNGYYNFFFGSVAKNNDSRYGWNNKNGIWNPALTNWVKSKTGNKAYRLSGNGSLNSDKVKDYLIHGQTIVALVPSGNITHWVCIYGYNNDTFYIADPWGSSASASTGKSYTLTGADLNKKLTEAANRKGRVNGEYTREGVSIGAYKNL